MLPAASVLCFVLPEFPDAKTQLECIDPRIEVA
jgi:hypothetical protein